jgi:hypothetical protein
MARKELKACDENMRQEVIRNRKFEPEGVFDRESDDAVHVSVY